MTKRRLFAYDNFAVLGGAELVSKFILDHFDFDRVIVGAVEPEVIEQLNVDKSKLTTLHAMSKSAPLLMLKNFLEFMRYRNPTRYDTVMVSGIFAPLLLLNIKARNSVYYCHTPPRFASDLKDYYKAELSFASYLALRLFSMLYLPLYKRALGKADHVLANSKNTQKRLFDYFGVSSTVVYPPCNTNFQGQPSEGYFLSTARLEPYKRVLDIVEAFKQMPDKRLIMISGGSLLEKIKNDVQNHPNITVKGWVSEEEKKSLIERCEATIYIPRNEDFGMSPVESIAAGKPVIGVNEGGLKETIKHLENGYLLDTNQSAIEQLRKIVHEFCIPAINSAGKIKKFSYGQFVTSIGANLNGNLANKET